MTALIAAPSEAKQRYDELGTVQVRQVLPPHEVAEIRELFTSEVQRDQALGWDDHVGADDVLARYPRFVHPHRQQDTAVGACARRLMTDPRILDLVEDLIGPALGAQSMFYFKPPGARGQALHQDNQSLNAHPESCLAAWIAIDDCDGDNGGLIVVPGSHRAPMLCPEPADEAESFASLTVQLPADVEREQTVMLAGDVLFFHGSTVHGSLSNRSIDRFRRALIFHYIPAASERIAAFYQPLVARDGSEVWTGDAIAGGPCGEGWLPAH